MRPTTSEPVAQTVARPPEQTRAQYPDAEGFVEREGVRIFYERYGEGDETVLLLPPWSVSHSRVWKLQIPYFARHFRVLTFDGRGNGHSDRPHGPQAYSIDHYARDALAVMDGTDTARATVIGYSRGGPRALALAAEHPEPVARLVLVAPSTRLAPWPPLDAVKAGFDIDGLARRRRKSVRAFMDATLAHPAVLRSRTFRHAMMRLGPLEPSRRFARAAFSQDYEGFLEWFLGMAVPGRTRRSSSRI